MDDFEYAVISDPNVEGFFTSPDGRESEFLSEEIAEQARVARKEELREIKQLRGSLAGKRRRGGMSAANYERGIAILDSRQECLERADQPQTAFRMPEPLDPYGSPMMTTVPLDLEPSAVNIPVIIPMARGINRNSRETPRQTSKRTGQKYYFSNRLCVLGHKSARYTSTACCVACQEIWRSLNVDKTRKHSRDSHQRRRDREKPVENRSQD